MMATTFGQVIVASLAGWLVVRACRCSLGWHPREGRMMMSGSRSKGMTMVTWRCGACHREIGRTKLRLSHKTLRTLHGQAGAARERSRMHVVKKADVA